MLFDQLILRHLRRPWRESLPRFALLALYLLMTVQFVGSYLFLGHPYISLNRFGHGYERLPFQTRLLLAPFFRWAESSPLMARYASHLSLNYYFFPKGVGPGGAAEFWLDLPCVLIAGWVAVRIYQSASRTRLLDWLVYPLFLVLCTVSYILHVVQNYRFLYDMPAMAFFALGLYLIYFRKSVLLLVALFAVATLNRETTLLLIPFFLLSACVLPGDPTLDLRPVSGGLAAGDSRETSNSVGILSFMRAPATPGFAWRNVLSWEAAVPALLMALYWVVWHIFVFHLFRHNSSEYYSRIPFNLYCLRRLRYYPQLLSAFGYLLPLMVIFRKQVHDAQLRIWMATIPAWYALMFVWGILVETRVFGELLPYTACVATLIAEERIAVAMQSRGIGISSKEDEGSVFKQAA
jgi:hypothetical protein